MKSVVLPVLFLFLGVMAFRGFAGAPAAADVAPASPAAPAPCPVFPTGCTCGCQSGGECLCSAHVAAPKKDDLAEYRHQGERAKREGKPLVVFIACPKRPIAGCLAAHCATFPGATKPTITVARMEGGEFVGYDLPADASDEAIRAKAFPAAAARPVSRIAPAPPAFLNCPS